MGRVPSRTSGTRAAAGGGASRDSHARRLEDGGGTSNRWEAHHLTVERIPFLSATNPAGRRRERVDTLDEAQWLDTIGGVPGGLALFDDHARLVLCNGAYRRFVRWSGPRSIIGRPYGDVLDAWLDDLAFSSAAERARFRAERLSRFGRLEAAATDLRTRDHRHLRVVDRRTPDGGVVNSLWDRTDDVMVADRLREALEAAESASQSKSDLIAWTSHEIRNPLNAVLGFAELLDRDEAQPLSDRHRVRVRQILKNGAHLMQLVNDLVDLSRLEAGALRLSCGPVDVVELLMDVKEMVQPLAAPRGIRVQAAVTPRPWPAAMADRTRLLQIALNLVSNAIKFNRPSGTVMCTVTAPRAGIVRLTVRDTGVGIPFDAQERLFRPFERAGQESGPIKGAGIGLYLTRRLAESMGGSVGFRSWPSEGSDFWVDLPVHVPSEPTA